jgi:ATP-binding cassette subfamily F protein 3
MYARPHGLVLDEPTNNRALEVAAALADRVKNFNGGVPIVSHDPCFGGRVAEKVCAVERGAVAQAESFDSHHGPGPPPGGGGGGGG